MLSNNYYTPEIENIARCSIEMIKDGYIRNHKLGNSSAKHSGEIEEIECSVFADFLKTKNCYLVRSLRGSDNNV